MARIIPFLLYIFLKGLHPYNGIVVIPTGLTTKMKWVEKTQVVEVILGYQVKVFLPLPWN